MKQPGFSMLELIVVMAVSAIIMTSLFQIYNQVTRNMIRVERFVFEDTQILALENRFEKDLSGLSAIWFTQGEVETKQLADGEKNLPAPEKRKRSNYFYSVNKDGHLDTLTFITTNALQSYGESQDRFVRVLYQIEVDPKHEDMYRLMRKEISMPTENIDEEVFKQGKFYELVGGIKSIEMTYQLIDKIELQKLQQAKAKSADLTDKQIQSKDSEEKKPLIRSVKQWGMADIKQDEKKKESAPAQDEDSEKSEKQDLGGAAVPKFVEMKIVFGASDKQLEREYKLEFSIPATVDNIPKGMSAIKKQKSGTPGASEPKSVVDESTDKDTGMNKKDKKSNILDLTNAR